jgi:hypothetical protein
VNDANIMKNNWKWQNIAKITKNKQNEAKNKKRSEKIKNVCYLFPKKKRKSCENVCVSLPFSV